MKMPLPFSNIRLAFGPALLILLALSGAGWAQSNQQIFDFFTTRDGMADNNVTALFHQPNGYLWVGTEEGLSRFDGQIFENFSEYDDVPQGKIVTIAQSTDQRLWVASALAVAYWEDHQFHGITQFNDGIRQLLASRQSPKVWVSLENGLAQHDGAGWTVFNRDQNFPDFPITQLYEDKNGQLWVGFRNGGLLKFDPETASWRVYGFDQGLPHLTINNFLETSDGQFWIATHGGLAILDGETFIQASFNQELPSPIIYRLFEDSGSVLWMTASNAGAVRWDGETLQHFDRDDGMASNFSVDFLEDHWGHIWILCRGGVSIFQGGELEMMGSDSGLQGRLMTVFLQGSDGLIWIGSTAGLNRYEEPRLKTYIKDPAERLVQSSTTRSILTDQKGRMWFPTFSGLGMKDKSGFFLFDEEKGLPSKLVLEWLEKKNGQIWVGTERGAALFNGKGFTPLSDPEFLGQVILHLIADSQDRIWIVTSDWNIYRQKDATQIGFDLVDTIDGILEMVAHSDGSIWLSQMSALTRIDAEGTKLTFPLEDLIGENAPISRHFDRNGTWWLATTRGLFRFNSQQKSLVEEVEELSGQGVSGLVRGSGNTVWFNTLSPQSELPLRPGYTGLGMFDGKSFHFFTKDHGVQQGLFHELFLDSKGQEWFFSNKGLSRLVDGYMVYTGVSDGLAGNRPSHLFWDSKDHLWITTNGGVNKQAGGLMTTLGPDDGILDTLVYQARQDTEGSVWIRSRGGVQRYRENPYPPEIEITGVFDGDRELPVLKNLTLNYTQNNLIFHLRGIHLSKGANQMHFDYTLKGKQNTWHGTTRESRVHFPSLSPDAYTFTVRAYSRDLEGSNKPATFSFQILPPWWFSTWFLITAILVSTGFAYLIYRIRLRVRLEKARVFSELQTAHDMQLSLMPKSAPITSRLQIFGTCEPAKEVGGDYFDYFWLDDDHEELGIAIMDVAGKSMEAAIISVMASGLVCSEIGQRNSPSTILSKINFPMYQKTGKKIFTTGLVASLHTKSLRFRWSNAGHLDPILIRNRKNRPLEVHAKRDLPLGAVRHWEYQESETLLEAGDLLLVYTDGVTEASDKNGDFYGTHRLVSLLESHSHLTSKELVFLVLEDVKKFAGPMPQYDDITLVAIHINPPQKDVTLT